MCVYFLAVLDDACVASAYSFASENLFKDYGIVDMHRMTAGVVKVAVPIYSFLV